MPAQPNPLAIASLVVGILSVPCVCACYGFPFNVLAIVLGGIAVVQGSNDPAQAGGGESGDGRRPMERRSPSPRWCSCRTSKATW